MSDTLTLNVLNLPQPSLLTLILWFATVGVDMISSAYVFDLVLNQNTIIGSTPNITLGEITFQVNNGTNYIANSSEEFINNSVYFYRNINIWDMI